MDEQEQILLEIKNLSVSYKKMFRENRVLDNVSCKIYRHKITIILGRNGSGKSTLLKTVSNASENGFSRKIRLAPGSEILFRGKNILRGADGYDKAACDAFRKLTAYSIQTDDVEYYEKNATFREALLNAFDVPTGEAEEKTDRIIGYFNVQDIADKRIKELSGGQLRLLSIMECLVQDDKQLYLVDEPYNDLDEDKARRVSNYIMDLYNERPEVAIVIVTHCKKILNTRNQVNAYAIEDGKMRECGYSHVLCLGGIEGDKYIL